MRPRPPLFALFVAALCACGPKVLDTDGDSASGGDTTGGGSTGGGTGGQTGGAVCEAIADVAPSPAVTVTLRNDGADPVFLVRAQGCDYVDPLTIAGPDGDTPVAWSRGSCSFTCSEVAAGFCGCPAACAQDSVLVLSPGGKYTSAGGSEVAGCFDPNNCSCTPNADGWCEVAATGVGGTPRQASGMLAYPGTAVDVVF